MTLATIQVSVVLTEINCGECGGTYALNERYRKQQHEKGGSWHCPYCQCGWGYSNNSENEKLKRELEAEKKRKEWAQQEARNEQERRERAERQLTAQKGVTTRLKNRVSKGVCPCCTRSFTNLHRHMTTQHPDYTKSEAV